MDTIVLTDLSLRRLFCDFLSASLLVVVARGEDNVEIQVGESFDNVEQALITLAATLSEREKIS